MKLLRIETPAISHFAYLLAADSGQAAVVDPRRDVDEYLDAARALGVTITHVIETHRQEDFVMGSRNLAERAGATVVNGFHDLFGRGDVRLHDGDELELGELRLRALHTPGHTPESMSYAVYTSNNADQAWCVFTGDALFFGDTGRTDLTDTDRAAENAALLHASVHGKIAPLGDATVLLPAHGAGSVCGSGMAKLPYSTIGFERRYNKVFTRSRDEFARHKAAERLPRPPYFRHMEQVNLAGGLPELRPSEIPLIGVAAIAQRPDDHRVIDTREPEGFAGGHVAGSHSIWMGGLPVFGGWIAGPDTPLYLITGRDSDADIAISHLARIGIDRVQGVLAGGFGAWRKAGRPIERAGVITPRQLSERRDGIQVLDVRDADEFDSGHIAEARNLYVGHLEERLHELKLDRERPVAVTCSIGHRSGLGVSILRRAGFTDVRNLLGGMTAWKQLALPVES